MKKLDKIIKRRHKRNPLVDLMEYAYNKDKTIINSTSLTSAKLEKVLKHKKDLDFKMYYEIKSNIKFRVADWNYFMDNNMLEKFIDYVYEENFMMVEQLIEEGSAYNDLKFKIVKVYYNVVVNQLDDAVANLVEIYEKLDVLNDLELSTFHYVALLVKYHLRQMSEAFEMIQYFDRVHCDSKQLTLLIYDVSLKIALELDMNVEAVKIINDASMKAMSLYDEKRAISYLLEKAKILGTIDEPTFYRNYLAENPKQLTTSQVAFIEIMLSQSCLCDALSIILTIPSAKLQKEAMFKTLNLCFNHMNKDVFHEFKMMLISLDLSDVEERLLKFYSLYIENDFAVFEKYFITNFARYCLNDNYLSLLKETLELYLFMVYKKSNVKSSLNNYVKIKFELNYVKKALQKYLFR